ncbi:MAG TPA: hypothetical protein VL172_23230, partial [Kofleriaceae bacterium]|nr:hypothetical protein [Kofleriaceae bacterium]
SRTSPTGTFDMPRLVQSVNEPGYEDWGAVLTADQLTVYFESLRLPTLGAHDIYVAHRSTTADGFGDAEKVTELSTSYGEWPVWISADGCTMVFTSNRPNPNSNGGAYDLWITKKPAS